MLQIITTVEKISYSRLFVHSILNVGIWTLIQTCKYMCICIGMDTLTEQLISIARHVATIQIYVICTMINDENIQNGNIFCVTGSLSGESTCQRWVPLTKASDAELWFFLSGPKNNRVAGDLRRHRAHKPISIIYNTHDMSAVTILSILFNERLFSHTFILTVYCLTSNMQVNSQMKKKK